MTMGKRFSVILLFLLALLFPVLLTSTAVAEDTGIGTLKQAVQAAWAVNSQSTGATAGEGTAAFDVSQANSIALNVADVVIDLDFAQQKYQYLAARENTLKLAADQADTDFKIGKIDAKTRDALKQQVIQNDFDLNYYQMQIDNNNKEFHKLTGTQISPNFDYAGAYLIADAGKMSLPLSATQGKDSQATEKQLNDVIDAFKKLGDRVAAYIDAGEKLSQTENDFKTGKAGNEDLEVAKAGKEQARIDALEEKAQYSKLLYGLDCSLQGYISRDVKGISDPIFQTSGGA